MGFHLEFDLAHQKVFLKDFLKVYEMVSLKKKKKSN